MNTIEASIIAEWQDKLEKGLDLNTPTNSGRTPLNDEIFVGRFDVARFLISRGARVDMSSHSPVVYASRHDDPEFIRHLIESGADVNGTDHFGNHALDTAVFARRHRNVVLLIESGAICEIGLVYTAALINNLDIVKTLVEAGCDVNKADAFGISKSTPLHMALMVSNPDMAAYLLDNGANALAQDEQGLRPFHLARAKGYDSLAAKLVSLEPKEWHDTQIRRQHLADVGLPCSVLDFLGEVNRRIDFSEADACVTKSIIFNTIEEVPDYTWKKMRVLDLLQTVENYSGVGTLCWFVNEGCLGTYDVEHQSWGFMRDLTIESFLERPAHHINCILQGGYTQFDPEFMDEDEEDV
jgi:hypothetical protein